PLVSGARRMKAYSPIILCILCFASPSSATTWRVNQSGSGDFTTIQAAIAFASTGDEIIVDAGTYTENIDYLGKNLWIRSASGLGSVSIDGGGAGSCASFQNHESPSAILEGFVLTNGAGTSYLGETVGGAIFCLGGSPSIRECEIVDNHCDYAAGIYTDQ